ncbi:MAG TPA: hypothetical protein VFP98_05565, partial [Candidatus Polarisedimenticolia bacterium]|nr:hypothetical protein [Candidatus Polarisedimenticolia bacterium]
DRDWPAHHLYRDMLAEESGRGAPSAVRLSPWLRHSALYLFLRFRVLGPAPSGEGPDDARVQKLFDLVQRDTVDEYFGVLAELSRRHAFRVLVAVFPYLDDLTRYRHMDENRRMADLSSRSGFLHLDLLPVFLDCERRAGQTIAFDEVHPNNIGHICAGRALASFVATRVLPGAREDG